MVRKFRNLAFVLLILLPKTAVGDAVPGEFILKFRNTPQTDSATKRFAIRKQLNVEVKNDLPLVGAQVVVASSREFDHAHAKALLSQGIIEFVEPNYIYTATAVPNDPKFNELWGMHNTASDGSPANIDIDAPKAWESSVGGADVVVGVVDTGVSYTHPDLASNIWTNSGEIPNNNIDDDNNGVIDDYYGYNAIQNNGNPLDDNGHGTHCAGTIGAVGNNSLGVAGVNWTAKIMPLKFLSSSGAGNLNDAVKAITYAVRAKEAGVNIKVLSNSWGGPDESQTLNAAIAAANASGILFVAAAGNAGSDNDTTAVYPANSAVPNVISVAAVDRDGNPASFSNYGATTVHVAAPGVGIVSTWLNDGYTSLSGTSMATPHVAGVATLLAGREPSLTTAALRARILETAKPLSGLQGLIAYPGIVSADNALANRLTSFPQPERLPGYLIGRGSAPQLGDIGSRVQSVDDGYTELTLPFRMTFYREGISRIAVSSNGRIVPLKDGEAVPTTADYSNRPLPGVSVYQDDLYPAPAGGVFMKSDANSVTLTWVSLPYGLRFSSDPASVITFQARIDRNGVFSLNYYDTVSGNAATDYGMSATVGMFPLNGLRGERLLVSSNTASTDLFGEGRAIILSPKKLSARNDVDGDGVSDAISFNDNEGQFTALLSSNDFSESNALKVSLGKRKDSPFICDLDGDERSDFLIVRNGKWFFKRSKEAYSKVRNLSWGSKTTRPFVGDFDGDGKCDIGAVDLKAERASILLSSGGYNVKAALKGQRAALKTIRGIKRSDRLLVGDFNGDGKESLAPVRSGSIATLSGQSRMSSSSAKSVGTVLSCDLDSNGSSEAIVVTPNTAGLLVWQGSSLAGPTIYGAGGDRPGCSGDYDGDGNSDLSVFRRVTREFFVRRSADGTELRLVVPGRPLN